MFCSGRIFTGLLLGLLISLGEALPLCAQTGIPVPAASIAEALGSLADRSGVAFVGQVVSIARQGGVVAIGFRVEQPVIGATGASYTLREWAGLWPQGQVRYHVGERALIFLRSASGAGFASPVDGGEGVLPVLVQGSGATPLVDIRRLAAAVLRPVGAPLADEANGAISLTDALAVVVAANRAQLLTTGKLADPIRRPLPGRGLQRRTATVQPVVGSGAQDSSRPSALQGATFAGEREVRRALR